MAKIVGLSRSSYQGVVQDVSGVLIDDDGRQNVFIINKRNLNFHKIVDLTDKYKNGDRSVMADLTKVVASSRNDADSIAEKLNTYLPVGADGRLSRRGNKLFMDGDPIDTVLESAIMKVIDSDDEDDKRQWSALANFLDSLYSNMNEYIRKQLFSWLQANMYDKDSSGFKIRPDGSIIGYKGCAVDSDGEPESINTGSAIVHKSINAPGKVYEGHIPNKIGSIVEMPRSDVENNPSVGCSTGLHIGTWGYASNWGHNGKVVTVSFKPEDVVSVPVDCDAQKLRVCRYEVLEAVDSPNVDDGIVAYDDDCHCGMDDVYDNEDDGFDTVGSRVADML